MLVDRTRWRLDIGYDGTNFAGWAAQTGQRTVQGELELWITRLLRLDEPIRLVCAGRTDAGVHARGQVAHADLDPSVITDGGKELARRLGRLLADDLVVRQIAPAPAGFDARYSAIWRRYVYRIGDARSPNTARRTRPGRARSVARQDHRRATGPAGGPVPSRRR